MQNLEEIPRRGKIIGVNFETLSGYIIELPRNISRWFFYFDRYRAVAEVKDGKVNFSSRTKVAVTEVEIEVVFTAGFDKYGRSRVYRYSVLEKDSPVDLLLRHLESQQLQTLIGG